MHLKTSCVSACAAALVTAALSAPAMARNPGEFVLKASGDFGWDVVCELDLKEGQSTRRTMRGRGTMSSGSIAVENVIGGSCSYDLGNRAEVKMNLESAEVFECPFPGAEGDLCAARITGPVEGSFDVVPK